MAGGAAVGGGGWAGSRPGPPVSVVRGVERPGRDGFWGVNAVGVETMPTVVFATAHDRHALRAFEANAVDYLLKPIQRDRFFAALKRAKIRVKAVRDDSE